jgi:predicted Na+-dependent transporter
MNPKVQFAGGLLLAVVLPAVIWLIFGVFHNDWVLFDKPAIPYLVSVCINLFILRYFIKTGKEPAAYGVMITTFVVMWVVFKYKM